MPKVLLGIAAPLALPSSGDLRLRGGDRADTVLVLAHLVFLYAVGERSLGN